MKGHACQWGQRTLLPQQHQTPPAWPPVSEACSGVHAGAARAGDLPEDKPHWVSGGAPPCSPSPQGGLCLARVHHRAPPPLLSILGCPLVPPEPPASVLGFTGWGGFLGEGHPGAFAVGALCLSEAGPPQGWASGSPVVRRWVQEFLNDENRGLDVLLEYLAFAQCSVA